MKLQKHRVSQSGRYPRGVELLIKQAGEQASVTFESERYQNQPSTKAREALDQLFRQAKGEGELGSELLLLRSYSATSTPRTPAYKPVVGGDPDAIREYAKLVREHVEKLNSLIATHRDLLLPYSQKCFNWPVRVAKRKPFRDDADDIIRKLEIGKETIANDPNARFDPTRKFGNVALNLIEQIELYRTTRPFLVGQSWPSWASDAQKLQAFSIKASSEEQKQWLAVVEKVLDEGFRDSETGTSYLSLLTAPSYKRNRRRKAAFFDKVRSEFETLWGSRRQARK
jgi:hypothetical protein